MDYSQQPLVVGVSAALRIKKRGLAISLTPALSRREREEIVLLYKGRELACKVLSAGEAPASPVDAKRLPFVMDKAVARQGRGSGHRPAPDHPWRRWRGDPERAKHCRQ